MPGPGLPGPPCYHRGLHRLLPAALAATTGGDVGLLPFDRPPRAVAVLVVDGLGERLLREHAAQAPTLSGPPGTLLHAPFPSTTATSLTSIGTALVPGEHGIVGYSFAVPGDDRPLFALTWSWDRHDPRLDAREDVDPVAAQPRPTAFEVAVARGARAVTVLRPEFVGSGLTLAGLRGGEIVEASDLEQTLDAVVDALGGTGPTLVYAHHGDLDALGHLTGPSSEEWCTELERIDAAVAGSLARLPSDAALVVTADHGMVHVQPDDYVELADHPELLAGVRTLTGDPRARQLHARDGAADEVLHAWREHCGDRAWVVARDEAIAAGWFGPRVDDRARARIGDVVVSARDLDVGWAHRDLDLLGGRMPGVHGALTDEELEVPAIVLTRDHA